MQTDTELLLEALSQPPSAILLWLGHRLRRRFAGRAVVEVADTYLLRPEEYAADGHAEVRRKPGVPVQRPRYWGGPDNTVLARDEERWLEIRWRGHELELLQVSWHTGGSCGPETYGFVVADDEATADAFLAAVFEHAAEVRGEVLVFEDGYWDKDADLYHAMRATHLDDLVLPGALRESMRDDLLAFVAARDRYARYGVPWKRGVLLSGPPGNGKTMCVKGISNALGLPCLYVKSLKAEHVTDHHCIQQVFRRARRAAPCLLILEDIDSLITDDNRAFFLNELDGFAENDGLITLATTNHEERLDPALLERPSRFDRRYTFVLPALAERRRYLALWNERLDEALRFDGETVEWLGEQTEGFSFAYLKELVLSVLTRWMDSGEPTATLARAAHADLTAQLSAVRSRAESHRS
ncbi:MAG: AAA family ATPase [Myxococcales bacterium]|nr:AAA family ATPase [Myxococcales bacterium]